MGVYDIDDNTTDLIWLVKLTLTPCYNTPRSPLMLPGFHGHRGEQASWVLATELWAHEVMGAGIRSDQSYSALCVEVRAAVCLPVLRWDRPEPSPDRLWAHFLCSVRKGIHVREINELNDLLYTSKDKHEFQPKWLLTSKMIWQRVNFLLFSENGGSSKCPLDNVPIKPEEVRLYKNLKCIFICTYHESSLIFHYILLNSNSNACRFFKTTAVKGNC